MAKANRFVPSAAAAEFHSISPPPPTFSSLFSFFSFGAKKTPPVPETPTHISIPKFSPPAAVPGTQIDVATALQYSNMDGLAPLKSFITDFALNHLHGGRIPYSNPGPEVMLTCGNTDGLGKVISLLGERGDNMLVEDYTYPNSIQTAAPYGIGIVPIGMDAEGIRAEGARGLRDILEHWDPSVQGRRPHLMYTVTVGQNPTGGTLSLPRRRAIYDLCERFDIIIIEDDPYWYLQYPDTSAATPPLPRSGKFPFLESLIPSFLTLDTAGRVIRLDTFSKTIAPGCRLGWITAQPAFITRLAYIAEASSSVPSGFSQALVATMLHTWGMSGWVQWLATLRDVYASRMTSMCTALSANAMITTTCDDDDGTVMVGSTRMYDFDRPDGGMFVWVRVHIETHPAYAAFTSAGRSKREMMEALWKFVAATQHALPCPGWTFGATESIKQGPAAERMRFCFAAVEATEVVDATRRWGRGVQVFWEMEAEEIVDWVRRNEAQSEVVEDVVPLGWAGGGGGAN